MLVQCTGDTGYQSLPVHRLHLKSKHVTGDMTVGIVDKIPVDGVHMLLGSDLAGGQADTCPVLCEKPVIDETCSMSVIVPELYPGYVVTRAMDKKFERESQSDVTGVQDDTDGDMTLSETVYSDWCEPMSVENTTAAPCALPGIVGC